MKMRHANVLVGVQSPIESILGRNLSAKSYFTNLICDVCELDFVDVNIHMETHNKQQEANQSESEGVNVHKCEVRKEKFSLYKLKKNEYILRSILAREQF